MNRVKKNPAASQPASVTFVTPCPPGPCSSLAQQKEPLTVFAKEILNTFLLHLVRI